MILRYYQEDAVNAALRTLKMFKHPLLIMPTGAGKSLVIAQLCKLLEKQILVITPRIKLLDQNAALIPDCGILSASRGEDRGENHRVIVGTIQTLIRREFLSPEFIIIDEAHLIPGDDSEYEQLLKRFPDALFIGLTATPFKGDQLIYEHGSRWTKSYDIGMIELIQKGYLVPPRAFKTSVTIDKDLYSDDDITRIILPTAIEKLRELKSQKTLVFCRDIEHAILTAELLRQNGETVFCIHSNLPSNQYDSIYNDFQASNSHAWLVNCNMVTTGVDLNADSIVFLRKMVMGGLYIQCVGRGLRPFLNKTFCAILDYGGNVGRFGKIDSPKFLKYEADPRKLGGGKFLRADKSCRNCEMLTAITTRVCEHCGAEFPLKTTIDVVSSNSQMLSVDLRKGIIVSAKATKKENNTFLIKYSLDNGDSAIRFVSSNLIKSATELSGVAIYRVTNGISKIISILPLH